MRALALICFLLAGCRSGALLGEHPDPLGGALVGVWELTEMRPTAARGLRALPMTDRVTLVALPGTPTRVSGQAFTGPYGATVWVDSAGAVTRPPRLRLAPHDLPGQSLAAQADLFDRPIGSRGALFRSDPGDTARAAERNPGATGYRADPNTYGTDFDLPVPHHVPQPFRELDAEYARLWQLPDASRSPATR